MATSMNIDSSDISTSSNLVMTQNMAAIVADALKQQASHFENIIGNLQSQISTLNIKKKTTKEKEATQSTFSTTSQHFSTPTPCRWVSKTATTSKSPNTPKMPTPVRKKHPLQLQEANIPKDFKSCKMMWGLYKTSNVPLTPSTNLLKEFYAKFSFLEQIEATLSNPASSDIITQESILSLKELQVRGGKIARGLGHIDQMSVLYISGVLAKVGIWEWAPDLEEPQDSLYNSASSGTYNYMNVVLSHTNSISLLFASYNHYVHYVMAARFKSEKAEAGHLVRESNRENIQKSWERVSLPFKFFLLFTLLTAYDLPVEENENSQDENNNDDDEEEEMNSEEEKGEEDDDDGFYKEGEYGNLYDDKAEEVEDGDE
ncbi:hypothetical protein CROQUDRAFT_57732 [Cronartium quercuum f. sp. fusiforme G11]|uniref:Uncharacterized protein n=1 Tax=Cronartium quercuum f. sp. fusiforme G11 TaxID=708437 RepID=A0A9P6NWC8_9BASI|nr:hypothetical protein CROQUDRAFT_57732 [Cronartium quercuum f. sp. fusiforme G11]